MSDGMVFFIGLCMVLSNISIAYSLALIAQAIAIKKAIKEDK